MRAFPGSELEGGEEEHKVKVLKEYMSLLAVGLRHEINNCRWLKPTAIRMYNLKRALARYFPDTGRIISLSY
jgi:hypothetical protein